MGQILNTLDLFESREYDAALQSANVLLDSYGDGYAVDGPLRPDLLLALRGAIASMQEQWSAAEQDYRGAIEATSPGRAEYWNNLAVTLAAQGRTDEAAQALNSAQAQIDQGGGGGKPRARPGAAAERGGDPGIARRGAAAG